MQCLQQSPARSYGPEGIIATPAKYDLVQDLFLNLYSSMLSFIA